MIRIDDSLLPQTSPKNTPEDASAPSIPVATIAPARQPNWLMIIAVGLLAYIVVSGMDCDRITPGPSPSPIDDKGSYVMILKDDTNLESMSDGQKAALSSTKISQWCRDNKFDFRKIDTNTEDKEMALMEPIWGTLKKLATDAPSLTISVDGQADSNKLPDGIDATIRVLESVK